MLTRMFSDSTVNQLLEFVSGNIRVSISYFPKVFFKSSKLSQRINLIKGSDGFGQIRIILESISYFLLVRSNEKTVVLLKIILRFINRIAGINVDSLRSEEHTSE